MRAPSPSSPLLPYQIELQPFVTTVVGNLAYDRFRRQLESIDHILLHHGIEERFLRVALDQELAKRRAEAEQTGKLRALCPGDQILFQKVAAQALRCCLLRTLTGETYRGFAQTLAESELRQWFCRLSHMGGVRVPSKSRLQDYSELVDASGLREVVMTLIRSASSETRQSEWSEPVPSASTAVPVGHTIKKLRFYMTVNRWFRSEW